MPWQPPSEDEFNREWLTPQEALDLLRPDYIEEHTRQRYLMARLKTGMIIAVNRTGNPTGRMQQFVPVDAQLWRGWDDFGDDHFWDTGDATFTVGGVTGYGDGHTLRCLDVRFDPDSFSGRPPTVRPPELAALGPHPEQTQSQLPAPNEDRPQLPRAEAERFCRAILTGWPGAGQDFAHEKAVLFFPDHKVSRDRFRSILRSIRGSTKPGKKPKMED